MSTRFLTLVALCSFAAVPNGRTEAREGLCRPIPGSAVSAAGTNGWHAVRLELGGRSVLAARVPGRLDPAALAAAERDGQATVIVSLAAQADLRGAQALPDKGARARYVFERLTEVAGRSQAALRAWLEAQGVASEPLWVVNALVVRATPSTLRAIAAREDVGSVRLARSGHLIEPLPEAARPRRDASELLVAERGIKQISADDVWKMGYTGEGVVVAVTDTGVAHTHPALRAAYRGADGDHDYNWFDAIRGETEPLDEDSHGTHVTGIVLGEAGARQIGVAPGARWIACRLIRERQGPDEATLRCLQWVLAPTRVDGSDARPELAPDVVNASWGGLPGEDCAGLPEIRAAIDNLVASGVLFVAAAGNSGPNCATICAPGSYETALTVANYDGPAIAPNSSRGPIRTDSGERVKPDVAAPGTDVNSSIPPARYANKSGTSMAAPHVSGVAALLISARADLRGQPEVLRRFLEQTAKPLRADKCGPAGVDGPNNSAGHGLVDARAAVVAALSATPPPTATPLPSVTPTATATQTPTPTATLEPPSPTARPHFEICLPVLGRRWSGGQG